MMETNFWVGNSELLAAMVARQFTVVNFDMSAPKDRWEYGSYGCSIQNLNQVCHHEGLNTYVVKQKKTNIKNYSKKKFSFLKNSKKVAKIPVLFSRRNKYNFF